MKAVCALAAALLSAACAAQLAGIPSLPDAAFPDTEASTNVAFAVGGSGNRRLTFTLAGTFRRTYAVRPNAVVREAKSVGPSKSVC